MTVGGTRWQFRHLNEQHPLRRKIESEYSQAIDDGAGYRHSYQIGVQWSSAFNKGLTLIRNVTTGETVKFGAGPEIDLADENAYQGTVLFDPQELRSEDEERRAHWQAKQDAQKASRRTMFRNQLFVALVAIGGAVIYFFTP